MFNYLDLSKIANYLHVYYVQSVSKISSHIHTLLLMLMGDCRQKTKCQSEHDSRINKVQNMYKSNETNHGSRRRDLSPDIDINKPTAPTL